MGTQVIATYDFEEDTVGLADFIVEQMAALPDDEIVVRVENDAVWAAKSAKFIRETLTDGSTVVNLVLEFAP